jgi:hypothetical protein
LVEDVGEEADNGAERVEALRMLPADRNSKSAAVESNLAVVDSKLAVVEANLDVLVSPSEDRPEGGRVASDRNGGVVD